MKGHFCSIVSNTKQKYCTKKKLLLLKKLKKKLTEGKNQGLGVTVKIKIKAILQKINIKVEKLIMNKYFRGYLFTSYVFQSCLIFFLIYNLKFNCIILKLNKPFKI